MPSRWTRGLVRGGLIGGGVALAALGFSMRELPAVALVLVGWVLMLEGILEN